MGLYLKLVGVQIRSQMRYRSQFVLDTLALLLVTGLEYASLALVFERFKSIQGWSLAEVAFLYGLVEMAFGLTDMIFGGFDAPRFGRFIRQGSFDQMMLRPIGITLQVLGSDFNLKRFGKMAVGVVIFSYALSHLSITWTVAKLLYFPLVVLGLVLFFGGLFIIGATIIFWTVESTEVMNIFTYGGSFMMSYPMNIYETWLRNLFTFVVPAIFLNYYPALFFLGKPDPFNFPAFAPFLAPLAGLAVFLISLGFWRFGLKHYQSTGS
ncbi:MAG: ABC-2 family transporter protein [Trueperaceae bacterium]|nr:ABC-2 family transporter protein [Trueperaceae bacterium]